MSKRPAVRCLHGWSGDHAGAKMTDQVNFCQDEYLIFIDEQVRCSTNTDHPLRIFAAMTRVPLFVLAALWAGVLQAQTWHGPRLGIGMATVNAGQFLAWTGLPKFGPIGGYSFDFKMNGQVSLMVEPMYVAKGSLVQAAQFRQTTRTTLHYVELPFVLKVSVNKNPQGLFLGGGLVPGYLLSGREQVTQDGQELIDRGIDTENIRRTQFSICLGLGFEKGPFELEVRGTNSITPFDTVVRRQNLVIGLHATFRFRPKPEAEEPEEEEEPTEDDYYEKDGGKRK